MDIERIETKMNELAQLINYPITHHEHLKDAMYSIKIGKRARTNDKLALVGDKIIDLAVIEKYYNLSKGEIDKKRQVLAKNTQQYEILTNEKIIDYAFNDHYFYTDVQPDNDKVSDAGHTAYIEGIVGAIYFDAGFDIACKWVKEWLLPRLDIV